MAKQPIVASVHSPLTAVLGSRAKVASLRVLDQAGQAIALRELVRRAGMAYRTIELAVAELLQVGVVEELEGGRERRIRIRSSHRLAPALSHLLRAEADFFPALRVELRTLAEQCRPDGLLTLAIVGAVATRTERIGDRLELLLVTRTVAGAEKASRRFDAAADDFTRRFGVTTLTMTYDLERARAMWRQRTAAASRAVAQAELLFGAAVREVLEDREP